MDTMLGKKEFVQKFRAGANGLMDAGVNGLIDAGLNGVGLTDADVNDAGLIDADGSSFPGGSQLPGVAAVGASSWLQGCRLRYK